MALDGGGAHLARPCGRGPGSLSDAHPAMGTSAHEPGRGRAPRPPRRTHVAAPPRPAGRYRRDVRRYDPGPRGPFPRRPRPSLRRGPRRLPRSEAPGDLEGTPDGATRLPDELRPDRARRYPDHAHALGRAPGDPQRGIGGRALAGQCPRMDAERGAPGRGRRRTALPGTGRRPLGPPGHGPPRCPGRRAPPTARAPHPAPALAPPPGRGARRGLGRRGRP